MLDIFRVLGKKNMRLLIKELPLVDGIRYQELKRKCGLSSKVLSDHLKALTELDIAVSNKRYDVMRRWVSTYWLTAKGAKTRDLMRKLNRGAL
jgi:DNA-binding HxlR family transcriptional regulator